MTIACDKTLTAVPENAHLGGQPYLWIRTAAGPQIGFGHLRRCMTLAQSLRDCIKPLFLLDSWDRWCREQLRDRDYEIWCEECDSAWARLPEPAALLIDTRLTDGLDHLIASAQNRRIPVISIHDMGLNPIHSDVAIDGSIVPTLFQDASFGNAKSFSGADYMVLDPAFQALHKKRLRICKSIRSVVVNLGGGDSQKYFPRILEGLKQWAQEAVEVIGLRGFVHWGQEKLAQIDWHPLHFRWECAPPNRFLANADLAITAGGLSAYEALCAGTPLIALSYDALQQAAINAIETAGACINLGPGDDLDPMRLVEVLSSINAGMDKRRRIALNGRKMVDGRGAERVSRIVQRLIYERSPAGDREIVE
jgi:UDP-2,4-diacetamido-2,4,6-trideoxy-beta-L-altropyranose hydrolase